MYLTIAVAVYNAEKYIDRNLQSIINALNHYKGDKEIEILMINDGSKDKTSELLKSYEGKIKNYRVINKENGGLSSVRNTCIENSQGKYLWMIDVDDEILEDSISRLVELDLSAINIFNFNQTSPSSFTEKYDNLTELHSVELKNYKNLLLLSGGTWRYIFQTEFIKNSNLRFLDNTLYEDTNLNPKLLLEAEQISIFDTPIYKYYINDNSIMTSTKLDKKRDILTAMNDVEEYFKSKGKDEEYFEELEYLYIHHLLYVSYVSIIPIDSKFNLLTELVETVNAKYPNWQNNKYLAKENIIKKTILKFIKNDNRKMVIFLLKLKKYLQKIIK